MKTKNKLLEYKKKIYLNKLEKLTTKFNFFESIEKKVDYLFSKSKIEKMINEKNIYNIEITRSIIKHFVQSVLFSILDDKNSIFSDKLSNFILTNNIDKVIFDNIHIFKEEIDFLNNYKTNIKNTLT